MGLSMLIAWVQLLFSSNIFIVTPTQLPPSSLVHLSSSSATVIASLLIALLAPRLAPLSHRRELLSIIGVLMVAGTAGVVASNAGFTNPYLIFACFALCSFGGAWIQLGYLEQFATQGIRGALICYGINSVLGAILCFLITLLPHDVAIIVTIVLPYLAAICLRPVKSEKLFNPQKKPQSLTLLFKGFPLPLFLIVGFVFFSFGSIQTNLLPTNPNDAHVFETLSSLAPTTIALLLAIMTVSFSYNKNALVAFYIAIPCLVVSSVILMIGFEVSSLFLLAIMFIGTELVRLLVFSILISIAINRRLPIVFAFALLSCLQFSGTLLGQFVSVAQQGNSTLLAFIILIALLCATLLVVMARDSITIIPVNNNLAVSEVIMNIATERKLTPRECEILEIWVAGHNSPYIQSKLNISKNTVKTHIMHIYLKTDTTNREELMNLVETRRANPHSNDRKG
jgi:DNA-binding CsgD family transcriptional regulator